MMDFRIQTFLTVCTCMNYTKAADMLHITQPAVTQHIKYLEEYYKTKLFIHDGKKLRLSHAGQILLQSAISFRNDERVMTELMANEAVESKPLRFGTTMTIGEFVIAKPLSRYLIAHPETEIEMTAANTSELLSMLKNGDIHFALVEGYFDSANYASMPYSTEDFICVCASSHAFVKMPHSIHDLLNERIIVREPGSGTRDILEKYLDASNLSLSNFRHIAQISGMHTIISLIEADCGITFLYKTAAIRAIEEGRLMQLRLEDFHVQHDFTFIWNKDSIFSNDYRQICSQLSS